MNENIFRAYDIRGNAEQDLTPDVLVKIGFVLGNKVKESGSDAIYVGHDSRLSCQRIFTDLCAGINSACLLYTSPSPRDMRRSRMPSSA